MPRVRYLYTDSDLPITPPPPLGIDDDSDHWWAGVQLSGVRAVIASAVLAASLSTSIALGMQQQTEDIVLQPPEINVGEEYWSPPVLWVDRKVQMFPVGEEVVPQPVAFGIDEEVWLEARVLRAGYCVPMIVVDEEAVPQVPPSPTARPWASPKLRSMSARGG